METKISDLCPKCGLHRQNALENHKNGDPTAWNLLRSCTECWQWAIEQYLPIKISSPVDIALAAMLEIISIKGEHIHVNPINIPDAFGGIRAILEALYEDGVEAGREMERTHQT